LGGLPEPLHAIYRVEPCLPVIEARLNEGNLKMTSFLSGVQVRYVEEVEVDLFDPDHLSFFNVNTPEDQQRAEALAFGRGRQRSRSRRES
jgi:molybdopterin-guanine dinucleotide biosynthesis protein A